MEVRGRLSKRPCTYGVTHAVTRAALVSDASKNLLQVCRWMLNSWGKCEGMGVSDWERLLGEFVWQF